MAGTLNELDKMRDEALVRPYSRARLEDRATRAGRAILEEDKLQADKWFALAVEIRQMGSPHTVEQPKMRESASPKPAAEPPAKVEPVAKPALESEPAPSAVIEEPEPPVAAYRKGRKGLHAKGKYYDEHQEEILTDRLVLGHRAALRKWDIPTTSWGELKWRWRRSGIIVHDLRGVKPGEINKPAVEIEEESKEEVTQVTEIQVDPRKKPDNWDDMTREEKDDWYNSKKDLILKDLEELKVQGKVAKLWGIDIWTISRLLIHVWEVKPKQLAKEQRESFILPAALIKPESWAVMNFRARANWYDAHRDDILALIEKHGFTQVGRGLGMSSSVIHNLRQRQKKVVTVAAPESEPKKEESKKQDPPSRELVIEALQKCVDTITANHNSLVKQVEELGEKLADKQKEKTDGQYLNGLVIPMLPVFDPTWSMLVQCDYFKAYAEMVQTLASATERYHTAMPQMLRYKSYPAPTGETPYQGVKIV